jgi:hypothetical protein
LPFGLCKTVHSLEISSFSLQITGLEITRGIKQ